VPAASRLRRSRYVPWFAAQGYSGEAGGHPGSAVSAAGLDSTGGSGRRVNLARTNACKGIYTHPAATAAGTHSYVFAFLCPAPLSLAFRASRFSRIFTTFLCLRLSRDLSPLTKDIGLLIYRALSQCPIVSPVACILPAEDGGTTLSFIAPQRRCNPRACAQMIARLSEMPSRRARASIACDKRCAAFVQIAARARTR
jgi:hypothetical protein